VHADCCARCGIHTASNNASHRQSDARLGMSTRKKKGRRQVPEHACISFADICLHDCLSFLFSLSPSVPPQCWMNAGTWHSPRSRTSSFFLNRKVSQITTQIGDDHERNESKRSLRGLKRSTEGILCCCWCVGMSVHVYVCVVVCMWVWVDLGSECRCTIMQGGILFSQCCSDIAHEKSQVGVPEHCECVYTMKLIRNA